jgi:hypothetical protein
VPLACAAWSAAGVSPQGGARGPYDLGPYQGQAHQEAAGIVFEDTASVLFGVEGLEVIDAERGPDGSVTVWVITSDPGAAACPGLVRCRERARRGEAGSQGRSP